MFGLAKTSRLQEAVKDELAEAKARHQSTGKGARLFRSFPHRTLTSWSRVRRVVAKAEHLAKGANPRFIVTSLDEEAIGREASVRAHLLRPGDDGEPAQGAAARPVRGPDVVHADALQSSCGSTCRRWPMN